MIFSTNPSLCPCRVGIVDRFAVVINQTVSAYFPVVVVFYRAAEQQTSIAVGACVIDIQRRSLIIRGKQRSVLVGELYGFVVLILRSISV